jgi:hypothetical protein
VLNEAYLARGQRADTEIQFAEMEALQVWHVTRDGEPHDLAITLGIHLIAASPAFQEREAASGAISLTHNVLVGPEVSDVHGQAKKRLSLALIELEDRFELADDWMIVGLSGGQGAPCGVGYRREDRRLSTTVPERLARDLFTLTRIVQARTKLDQYFLVIEAK